MECARRATHLRRGYVAAGIEGKVTRVGASKPGGERVSVKNEKLTLAINRRQLWL